MKSTARLARFAGATALCAAWMAFPARAQEITQSFTLRPGWNAVYLEVEPRVGTPAVVFSNLPIASVWTWAERLTAVAFIQDPSEAAFNRAGWLGWFPPGRPESFLSNLHAVQAHRSYLIKLNPGSTVVWQVTGRPSLRRVGWSPDAFNLRGFNVDTTNPPTFLSFFRPAKAHYNASSGSLENIYRLAESGQWTLVSAADRIQRGTAYWVYCRGESDFVAPVEVRPQSGDGVDFDSATEEFELELHNRTTASQTLSVQVLSASAPGALAYRVFDPAQGGYSWPNLPTRSAFSVAANSTHRLRLAIRRGAFSAASYTALLGISDGAGSRFTAPVAAQKPALAGSILVSANPRGPQSDPDPLRGLWVGAASVNRVNEINSANPTNLTVTQTDFPLRLLLHVDATGRARFLKEVIQMWHEGTYATDAQGNKVPDQPGEYVLLTDDRLLGQFQGATLRDGVPVGRRLSTAAFDFDGGPTNYLEMSGTFAISNRLNLTLELGPNLPTNPFRHKYHPDHDNLDGRFVSLTNNFEAYPVTRQIELEFTGSDPTGKSVPDYGYSVMGGIYRETLVGLHKNPIHLQGTFRLTRACYTAELNPSPTP